MALDAPKMPGRESLDRNNSQEEHAPSQDEVNASVLGFVSRMRSGEADSFEFIQELPERITAKADSDNAYTRAYRAIFNVAREHPEFAQELGEIEGLIIQNPQMMHPAHIIDVASDVMWDPRIHTYLKSTMIHGLGYALRFMKSGEYENAIAGKLDFTNAASFSGTAHFLEFMQNLYNIGDAYSYHGDDIVISRVRESLQRAVEKKQGSYLLNVRAQELLAEMDGSSWVASGFDRVPFMIMKDRYARHKEDGLYVAAPEQRERIQSLIAELKALEAQLRPPQELVDAAFARGEREVWWTPDQKLMRARNALYESIDNAFTQRVSYAELAPGGDASSEDGRIAEEHDFAYLQRKPIRETVEKDFEIQIGNLSLQDQYKLLRVLKTVEYGKATPLLLEGTRTLWKSGVKDYLNEIRGGAMEVRSGDLTEEDQKTILNNQELQYKGKYPEGEMRDLRQGLEKTFRNPDTRFYLYRKDGEIVTSIRFENQPDTGGVYMGSFITNPKYEGGAMGQALLEVALEKENVSGPIQAVCDPSLVAKYAEFGFELVREGVDEHGVPTAYIVRYPSESDVPDEAFSVAAE